MAILEQVQQWLTDYDAWAVGANDDLSTEQESQLRQDAYKIIDELVKDNPISGIKQLKETSDFIRQNFNDDTKVGVDMLATFLQDCEYVFDRVLIKSRGGK